MSLLRRFDPPAHLPEFAMIPGQAAAWHRFMTRWFDTQVREKDAIAKLGGGHEAVSQFFNPAVHDHGPMLEQPIVWNAFPKELLRWYGRARAMIEADTLWPYSRINDPTQPGTPDEPVYRPQVEYCEWHVVRDPNTGEMKSVTFTSEPPEYWQAMFGDNINGCPFPGSPDLVLTLYRKYVSRQVLLNDLIAQKDLFASDGTPVAKRGAYNPYNKWNTTHGVMHLNAPPNSIVAEVKLAADASVLRKRPDSTPVPDPQALICCAAYGGPDRNSDPTIGASVNALARLRAYVTLANPVGLYMDHIDLSGWSAPRGLRVEDCVRVLRGDPNDPTKIERLLISAPRDSGFTVSDLSIGGEPIVHGGQIAECITVKLVGAAAGLGSIKNHEVDCTHKCCIDPAYANSVDVEIPIKDMTLAGTIGAFGTRSSRRVQASRIAPHAGTRRF